MICFVSYAHVLINSPLVVIIIYIYNEAFLGTYFMASKFLIAC